MRTLDKRLGFSLLGLSVLSLGFFPTAAPTVDPSVIAVHHAPVIYQGAASDQDYITRVDFDGDWIGNNNWENQPTGGLAAHVYYSVIETETHWFIFYSLFHPRDYEPFCLPILCHENDMESVHLVIVKDGSQMGRLLAMQTLAHGLIYLYAADPLLRGGFLPLMGQVLFEDGHPIVYVETYGHGIYGHPIEFKGGVVVYRVGDDAEVPEGIRDEHVAYKLISIHETLWPRRGEIGPGKLFDQPFEYRGHILPAAFDGDNYGEDKANAPWGYGQALGAVLTRAEWLLDPAKTLAHHAAFVGSYSLRYLYNPYLDDLGLLTP